MKKIIYDVGSNNGDDIPYYLMKGDMVVAIEANPVLCEDIRRRFADEIRAGRLILESCVVTVDEGLTEVDFYLHNTNHVLSQLPVPSEAVLGQFAQIKLPSKSILSIIRSHGSPYYIKIDIEHYDVPLLKAIFAAGLHPPYISAEAHSLEVFLTLAVDGSYNSFKMVDGYSVSRIYADCLIDSRIKYSFPSHSAGPFGGDIHGEWMTADNFFRLLAFAGLGWKDIHATNIEHPDPSAEPRAVNYLGQLVKRSELMSHLNLVLRRDELLFLIGDRARRWFNRRLNG
jgi:FkbM family methyltransferase